MVHEMRRHINSTHTHTQTHIVGTGGGWSFAASSVVEVENWKPGGLLTARFPRGEREKVKGPLPR